MMKNLCFIGLAAFFLSTTAVNAEFSPIRAVDWERLVNLQENYEAATRTALLQGAPEDVAVLREVMSGQRGPEDLAGTWRCRILKLGGLSPLTVYRNFECRITQIGPREWYLEKLTGSQRTRGIIRDDDGFLAYLGVGYVSGGPALDYPDLPAEHIAIEPGATRGVIGEVHQMAPDRARILLPQPMYESDFNILYLTR